MADGMQVIVEIQLQVIYNTYCKCAPLKAPARCFRILQEKGCLAGQEVTMKFAKIWFASPLASTSSVCIDPSLELPTFMQGQGTTAQSRMKMFMRFIAVLIIPFTSSMPQVSPYPLPE